MQLEQVPEARPVNLPRVYHQFIGIGHELENHKKQRKQIQQEAKSMENRVTHLEKQKNKARKIFQVQKKKLQEILTVKQRQELQAEQKAKVRYYREQQLERLKKQNQIIRVVHKSNLEQHQQQIKLRNHSEYSNGRQKRLDGQYRKRVQKNMDITQKRDQWVSLNISKEKGKMRIDKYYKKKNKQYLEFYKSRIQKEDQIRTNKLNRIKQLGYKQQKLRDQLEASTIRASQMVQLITKASRTLSPMDTRSIQAELSLQNGSRSKLSRIRSDRQSTTSGRNKSYKTIDESNSNNKSKDQVEVEQNIQLANEDDIQKLGFRMLAKRKKNKHVNRYREYQAF